MVIHCATGSKNYHFPTRFWKICNESQDITKNVSKIGLPNQNSKIWNILADILELGAYFLKPIFVLKPWVQAGWFEYHDPYSHFEGCQLEAFQMSERYLPHGNGMGKQWELIKIQHFCFFEPP